VIDVMNDNLRKAAQRGENLDELNANAEDLSNKALLFKDSAHKVRKDMWWKNIKMQLILAGIIITILIIIIVAVVLTQQKK
ncbi:Vesicle-associated membrane protein 4, partial [Rhizoclosmatium hyalinum]